MDQLLGGLRAAGEKTRLRILFLLSTSELTVKDLTGILGQSQPRVSRHLKLMCEAKLLERHREGSWVFFRRAQSGPAAAVARMISQMVPAHDRVVARDLERLQRVLDARAEAARAYFEANAADWDTIRSLHVDDADVEAAMLAALGGRELGVLFDLGTGTGRMLELFADRIEAGTGIDTSREMLSLARANLANAGRVHCQVRYGDIFNLPYDNACADTVIIHQVLHYLEEPGLALQEAARIMKREARLLVVDFAPHDLEYLRDDHAHRRLGISAEKMAAWLERAGLEVARFRQLPARKPGGNKGLTVSIWLAGAKGAIGATGGEGRMVERVG